MFDRQCSSFPSISDWKVYLAKLCMFAHWCSLGHFISRRQLLISRRGWMLGLIRHLRPAPFRVRASCQISFRVFDCPPRIVVELFQCSWSSGHPIKNTVEAPCAMPASLASLQRSELQGSWEGIDRFEHPVSRASSLRSCTSHTSLG